MNKILKWALIISGVVVLILCGFWIYTMMLFGGAFDTYYSKNDLIENYTKKTKEINALKEYINKIVPSNKSVKIEFDGNKSLTFFHVIVDGGYDSNWNIKVKSSKTDSLLEELGWTHSTLSKLKEKLDAANCISVDSGEPVTIGYQRSGMGEYFYKIFNHSLSDSLKKKYNDGCTYIYYKENIVLEYGGGAVGAQCFEKL